MPHYNPARYYTVGADAARIDHDGRGDEHRREAKMKAVLNYQERIVRDSRIAGGQAVFKGTRVPLRTVLASLAEGATTAEILTDFPSLREEDVRAAIAFAAISAQEDLPVAALPIS